MSKRTKEGCTFTYQKVYRYLCAVIEAAPPGEAYKLPSLRSLATRLKVSVSTVKYAYSLLEDEGRIQARPKSGYYLTDINPPRISTESCSLLDEVFASARQPATLALSSDSPTILLPLDAPLLMMERDLSRQYPHNPGPLYQPFGESELRAVLADRYTSSTQHSWQADDVYLGSDLRSVFELALTALDLQGRVALVESPCSWVVLRQLQSAGLRVIELPLNHQGRFDLQYLEDLLRREPVRLAVLSSTVNIPHGSMMPAADKAHVAQCLGKAGVWLFENDSYGEFSFVKSPVRYRDYADPDRLLVFAALDKIIGAEAPYGYILCRHAGPALRQQFMARTFRLPPIRQKAIARLFSSRRIDQHLLQLRSRLYRRMQEMGGLIHTHTQGVLRTIPPCGGATFWLEALHPVDMRHVFNALVKQQIVIAPGEIFSLTGQYRRHLRLSYTIDWSQDIAQALNRLSLAISEQVSRLDGR